VQSSSLNQQIAVPVHRDTVAQQRRQVVARAGEFFASLGMQATSPEPLVSDDDATAPFSSSAIAAFGRFLRGEELPGSGAWAVQPCAQFRDVERASMSLDEGLFVFQSLGALAPLTEGPPLMVSLPVLFDACAIPVERVRILAASRDRAHFQPLADAGFKVYWDLVPEREHDCRVGLAHVRARGAWVTYRRHEGGLLCCGTVLHLAGEGRPLGYGVALTVESLCAAAHGLAHVIQADPVSTVLDVSDPRHAHYARLLVAATWLFRHGVRPGRRNRRLVARQVVRRMAALALGLGWSLEQVAAHVGGYERARFGETSRVAGEIVRHITERYWPVVGAVRAY
jgi:hypothetical protein